MAATVQSPEVQRVIMHGHERAFVKMGEGPALLLLHGLACDHTTWLPVMHQLARKYTVIAPDLLGHGESDRPRDMSRYSMTFFGEQLIGHAVLTQRPLHDAFVGEQPVGQSAGGDHPGYHATVRGQPVDQPAFSGHLIDQAVLRQGSDNRPVLGREPVQQTAGRGQLIYDAARP